MHMRCDPSLRRRRGRCAVLGVALIGVTTAAHAFAHPGARAGEAFTFKFSIGDIDTGRARMAIGRPSARGGRIVIGIHAQAETLPWLQLLVRIDDDYQLMLDATNLLPLDATTVERGARERKFATHFSTVGQGTRAELSVVTPKGSGKGQRVLPWPVRDPVALFLALRAAPLADGDRMETHILDGNALWLARLSVHRGERVRLDREGAQPRAAVRIDGELTRLDVAKKAAPRHGSLWLSDDDDRVLLRMEGDTDLGRASLELTSYDAPARGRGVTRAPSLPGLDAPGRAATAATPSTPPPPSTAPPIADDDAQVTDALRRAMGALRR
jgi:hypothetical protein